MLGRVGSPAEAHFIRRLLAAPTAIYDGEQTVYCNGVRIGVQMLCLNYRLDALAEAGRIRLAIEIDGAHHTCAFRRS
jgi:very-short-patch-repair endonuclease